MPNQLVFFRGAGATDESPRVLHVGPLPPPWGGLAANLKYLLESQALSAFDMAVLNTARPVYREDVSSSKKIWHVSRLWKAVRIFLDTWLAIRRFRPAIVHIHSAGDDPSAIRDMLLILVAKGGQRRIVFQQFFWPDPSKFNGPRRAFSFFYKLLIPRATAILMGTPLHVELASRYIDVSRAQYVPTTCVTPLDAAPSARVGDRCRVTYVGRLSRLKGTYDLIEAIALLSQRAHDFHFVLVGVGATEHDDQEIRALIESRAIGEYVTLAGRVSDEEKWRILSDSDLMVFPSHGEQFGVTVLEGFAAGLPVITTRVDYLPRLVLDGENGLVVSPGRPDELAAALLRLGSDKQLRARIGRTNRLKFEREFALEVVAQNLRRIYEAVLKPKAEAEVSPADSHSIDAKVAP